MVYILLSLGVLVVVFLILIWLRKVQFDAVHRNFLDLVDHYGGRVIRDGFAIRPKYSGVFKDHRLSLSISSERKTTNNPRRFYISIYMQAPSQYNYTIMSTDWLNKTQQEKANQRFTKSIIDHRYTIEVTKKKQLKKLNIGDIEKAVKQMHPFAYALISRKGLIVERVSENLVADTEFKNLSPLLEAMDHLSLIDHQENNQSSTESAAPAGKD